MDITKDLFKKIILFSVAMAILCFGIEFLNFRSEYGNLEEQLHQGYLLQMISAEVMLVILLLLILLCLISLFLLYRFNPLGRFLYLLSMILLTLVIMLSGDWIQNSLFYPLEMLLSFLDLFILYLIYFSPLREEFK